MEPREFNSVMPPVHAAWAARVFGMRVNEHKGIDLVDDERKLGIEVKFFLTPGARRGWTPQDFQLGYNDNGMACYWALGIYELNSPVSSIRYGTRSYEALERRVARRELYLVEWDWMEQFPPSRVSGSTQKSVWENTFRYPKMRNLPAVVSSRKVDKGIIHFTEGVKPGLFPAFDLERVPF